MTLLTNRRLANDHPSAEALVTRAGGAVMLALVALALATASAPAASTQPADAQWLQRSITADRFEIAAAKIAVKRSHNGHLGALAGRLLSDHTKALRQATSLAQRSGVPLPADAPSSRQWELHILSTLAARSFAREYAALEIAAHDEAILDAGMEVKSGQDASIKKFADATSTMLAKHLRLARQTMRAL